MHHFGEDSTDVNEYPDRYEVIFRNKSTGQRITMNIPRKGVYEDPNIVVNKQKVRILANDIAHRLRDFFA